MSSGFGETRTRPGKAKEARMVAAARAAGMRMVGPNTQGLANFGTGAVTSFSTMFIEREPMDGPMGIVSQSGAMSVVPSGCCSSRGSACAMRMRRATMPTSTWRKSRRRARRSRLKLLLLYLESIPRPELLAALAAMAHARGVSVVALKSGRTDAGQQAAKSHTGALANEDRVVDAFLERHGIWRARNIGELVSAAQIYLKGWKPKGRRLVAISDSGATCVMAADAATFAGLEMVRLEGPVRQKLDAILPTFASAGNPIDITAALLSNSRLFSDILPVLAHEDAADEFLIGFPVAGRATMCPHSPATPPHLPKHRQAGRCLGVAEEPSPTRSKPRACRRSHSRRTRSQHSPASSITTRSCRAQARPAARNGRDPGACRAQGARP